MHPEVQILVDAALEDLGPEMRKKAQDLVDLMRPKLENLSPVVAAAQILTNSTDNPIGHYVAALWILRTIEAADEAEALRKQNEVLLTAIAELGGDVAL